MAFNKQLFSIFIVLAATNQFFQCLASRQVYLQFANDPNHPQLISVSDVTYNLVWSRYLEISATITVREDIDDGTNVKVVVSPEFPYAKFINGVDTNLCTFVRREFPTYGRLVEASGNQLPDRCPIKQGVYRINNFRINLDKYPMLWRGFDVTASLTFHKNGRILSKFDLRGGFTN